MMSNVSDHSGDGKMSLVSRAKMIPELNVFELTYAGGMIDVLKLHLGTFDEKERDQYMQELCNNVFGLILVSVLDSDLYQQMVSDMSVLNNFEVVREGRDPSDLRNRSDSEAGDS